MGCRIDAYRDGKPSRCQRRENDRPVVKLDGELIAGMKP
jgi:hypothetical protein